MKVLLLAGLLAGGSVAVAAAAGPPAVFATPDSAAADSGAGPMRVAPAPDSDDYSQESGPLSFAPVPDSDDFESEARRHHQHDEWLHAPYGEGLLTDPDIWESRQVWRWPHERASRTQGILAYNRVDRVRIGLQAEVQEPASMYPRVGGRLEYTTDRERWLYGLQVEQPLAEPGRLTFGVSMGRRTDWNPLHQVPDIENSLALLFGRNDYRDYFEREGFGAHLAWRVPDFSTVSLNWRSDDFRSIALVPTTRSWFNTDRPLRENPAIDDGRTQAVLVRLDRFAHRTGCKSAGIYHWVEMEWAGGGLGGDFDYSRLLADVRSVVPLSPVSTLFLRGVGGHTFAGRLPAQKVFPLGGVDGLRAQRFARFKGEQIILGQAEYQIELGRISRSGHRAGLYAIVFIDVGTAWTNPNHDFDLNRQHVQTDAGFGFSFSEDRMRIYFAKDLREPDSDFLVTLRLQRPF